MATKASAKKGRLRLTLLDPSGRPLQDTVTIRLEHQVLSDVRTVRNVDASKTIVIEALHQAPQGLYLLTVDPKHFRAAGQFIHIKASGDTEVELTFGGVEARAPEVPLHVRVTNAQRQTLGDAKVIAVPVLTAAMPGSPAAQPQVLVFDPQRGDYRVRVFPGEYRLQVEADGFEAQQRPVTVGRLGAKEVFVLGREGLPFYFKGKVRVPFEPQPEFLALSLRPGLDQQKERELEEFAARLGLKPEPVDDLVRDSFLRVFRFTEDASESRRIDVRKRLEGHRHVRHAGPLVVFESGALSFLSEDLVVRFSDGISRGQAVEIATDLDLQLKRELPYVPNGFLLRSKESETYSSEFGVLDACADLVTRGYVEYAEPDLVAVDGRDFSPDDPRFDDQPHHQVIHSEAAWDVTLGDPDIRIAVFDDGCDIDHEDLTNPAVAGWDKVVDAYDFLNLDSDPYYDASSHGSRSTGIAAGVADNSTGIAGVAPGCRVMPVRMPSGGFLSEWADAFIWMGGGDPGLVTPAPLAHGADVISCSIYRWDWPLSGLMRDVFDYLTTYGRGGRGCVVVFSAGNQNSDVATQETRTWVSYAKTLAVAASTISPPDADEHKVSTSNFGDEMDLCAPAGGPNGAVEARTLSTGNDDAYATHGQTSCACPQVAGTAALMLSANPDLTWVEVRRILRQTAVKIDTANVDPVGQWLDAAGVPTTDPAVALFSPWYGYGRLDTGAATEAAGVADHAVDIVLRDTLGDIGIVPSAGAFYNSPDIWVRNASPADEGALALPVSYDIPGPHQPPRADQDNWIYLRLRNVGTVASDDAYLRVYITHFPGTEFIYPDSFIPTNPPGTPATPITEAGTYLIAEVPYTGLAGGDDDIVSVRWPRELVPPQTVMVGGMSVNWHPCLLAEVSPHDGPPATGVHVWDDNNLAQKNISIVYPAAGDDFATALVTGHAANPSPYVILEVDRTLVPRSVQLYVDLIDPVLKRRLRNFIHESKPEYRPPVSEIVFLEETRIHLAGPGHGPGGVVMDVRPNTRLEQLLALPVAEALHYDLELRQHKGREVAFLGGRRTTHVPVLHGEGGVSALVIGGVSTRNTPRGTYPVLLRQRDPAGRLAGSAQVHIAVQ